MRLLPTLKINNLIAYPTGIGFRYFTAMDSERMVFFVFREFIGNT
jgi:hypothetical protein